MKKGTIQGNKCRNNQTLVLIISTYQTYHFEISNIIGMPNGARYRLRYKDTWISSFNNTETLIEESIPNGLNGQRALIVLQNLQTYPFINEEQNTSNIEFPRFYPIRHAIINSIERIGDVLYFEFDLGPIVTFPLHGGGGTDLEQQQHYLDSHLEQIWSLEEHLQNDNDADYRQHCDVVEKDPKLKWLDKQRLRFKSFVFFFDIQTEWNGIIGDENEETAKEEQKKWGIIVSKFIKLIPFEGIIFTKLLRIECEKEGFCLPYRNKRKGIEFMLKGNQTYELHFVQRSALSGPHKVSMAYYEEYINSIIPTREVFGKYDRFHLDFRTKRANIERNTQAIITFPESKIPSLEIPLLIRATKRRKYFDYSISLLAILAGVAQTFSTIASSSSAGLIGWCGVLGISIAVAYMVFTRSRYSD